VAEASRFLLRSSGNRGARISSMHMDPSQPTVSYESSSGPFDWSILLDDPSFLVINKPTGLLSQSTYGVDSLLFQVRRYLAGRESTSKAPFAELPHRIDRGTSGIVLVARNRNALRHFGEQFHSRKIAKSYLVAVAGQPEPENGRWNDWLRKIPDSPKAKVVSPDSEGAREAILNYRTLIRNADTSIHRVELETGRMHQIRLQFASRGFPVLGDQAYGSQTPWSPPRRDDHDEHFALHATSIAFRHPKDARPIELTAPLPAAWHQSFPEEITKLI
jgi:23S rRNA pseudouridine1911/1915/1917 synthase